MLRSKQGSVFRVTEIIIRLGIFIVGLLALGLFLLLVTVIVSRGEVAIAVGPNTSWILSGPGIARGYALSVLALAPVLAALVKLLTVVRGARVGDPFTKANAARLRAIAWLLLASYLIQGLMMFLGYDSREVLTFMSPWKGIGPVLLFFVVAQIFDHGADMRDELEGTV